MRSNSSNNSCRRRLAHPELTRASLTALVLVRSTVFLPAIGTLVHRQRLQLIHDLRAHLHQPMPMPQQLSQASRFSGIRHPDSRKPIFQQQLPHKSGILAVGLLLFTRLALISAGSPIHSSKPNSASSRSNQREYPVASTFSTRTQILRCFQVSVESLCFTIHCGSVPVHHTHQSLSIKNAIVLKASGDNLRPYNEHVRLLPPEPLVVETTTVYSGRGAGERYAITSSCQCLGFPAIAFYNPLANESAYCLEEGHG